VGLALEDRALFHERVAQLAKILDDAVVHDRELVGRMRVRVIFRRRAVGRPARMADADFSVQRLLREALFEIPELPFGAAARKAAAFQRRDARGVVAAIFETLQRIDQAARDRFTPENADNTAHEKSPLTRNTLAEMDLERVFG